MTDLSVLSADEAVKFLRWLDPAGLHNLVAIDPVTKAVEAATFDFGDPTGCSAENGAAWIEARNGQQNLYFSINAPSPTARRDSKLRRDEIGMLRAFAVDLDEVPAGYPWGEMGEDCMPSAVVDSGGGRWAFWKLEQPLPVTDAGALEAQNKALAIKFGADTVSTNVDRIARLPGTLNIPNAAKRKKGRTERMASVMSTSRVVYAPAEIAEWCPPAAIVQSEGHSPKADQTPLADLDAPASIARATKWLLQDAPEAVEGEDGDSTTFQVCARLKDFGVSRSAAFELLLDCWNEQKAVPPWSAADLLQKVRNAYEYGTAAPARNAANLAETEFEAAADAENKPVRRKMQLEFAGDIEQDLKAEAHYLIRDWYDRASMVVTYGESNSGKTHVVLDQALAIATGRPWAGKQTHKGLVVYVAAEGGFGVQRRIMAHKRARPQLDWANVPFALVRHPIDLMRSPADAKALIGLVKEAEARFGQKCVMVVIDTLSRALAGGDENSSSDMGAFVKRCDEIRAASGATLHVIHHAGKNTAKGARGHSLLRAAVDTEIEIESNTVLSRKQRDAEAPAELRFDYKPVLLGEDAEGVEVRSVVLDVWEQTEFQTELSPQTQKTLEAIETLITQKLQSVGEENACFETATVSPKEIEGLAGSERTIRRTLAELVEVGRLVKCKHGLYKLNQTAKRP